MIIRDAQITDNSYLVRLVEGVQQTFGYSQLVDEFLRRYSTDRCIVAEDTELWDERTGSIVGVSTWGEIRRNELVSHWNIVHKDHQGKGIGAEMMKYKYTKFEEMGINCFYTDVPYQFLVDWHVRHGFIKWRRVSFPDKKDQFGDLGYYQRMKKVL